MPEKAKIVRDTDISGVKEAHTRGDEREDSSTDAKPCPMHHTALCALLAGQATTWRCGAFQGGSFACAD